MQLKITAAGIIREGNRILLLNHVKLGMWLIPMGKVEEDESILDALTRELKEEVGIDLKELMPAYTHNLVYVGNSVKIKVFDIIKYSGIPYNKEPLKHYSMRWFNKHELLDYQRLDALDEVTSACLDLGLLFKN